jgi:hypothetical protein
VAPLAWVPTIDRGPMIQPMSVIQQKALALVMSKE